MSKLTKFWFSLFPPVLVARILLPSIDSRAGEKAGKVAIAQWLKLEIQHSGEV